MKNATRRFGVLFPPGNVAMERELHPRLPEGVAMHCNRLSRPNSTLSDESLRGMMASAERAARDLAQTYPEVIVYGCTSGSFLDGPDSDTAIAEQIRALTGIPAITTATAVRAGLRALGASRVYMVTPYPDEINRAEAAFLEHHGITVVGWDAFPCRTSEEIREVDSADVAAMVLKHRDAIAGCDAVFISCTQLFTMDQIESLEAELDRPIVSSNQACLWAALKHMRVASTGLRSGALLERFGHAAGEGSG